MTTPDPGTPPADPANPPTPPTAEEEAAYGKFKSWLDRYSEENKPADPPPDKTKKPTKDPFGGVLSGIFGYGQE